VSGGFCRVFQQAPKATVASLDESSKQVFRFVLRRSDDCDPGGAGSVLILATAYYQDLPGQPRSYGIETNAGSDVLDMMEARSALSWKQMFDDGQCSEERAIGWLEQVSSETGVVYFDASVAADKRYSHMYHGLSKCSIHLLIANIDAPGMAASFLNLFQIQFSRAEVRQRHAKDFSEAPLFAAACKKGVLDAEFLSKLRVNTRVMDA
jgi:hypothetical protein